MAAEGANVTFYDLVGVRAGASGEEVVKSYRKLSKQQHPDKAMAAYLARPGRPTERETAAFGKAASARYARLGVVKSILQGPARARYDYFLANGFPRWRGTGYYYSRYRPGLGAVLAGLFVLGGGAAHYAALYLGWKRQRDFVDRYIRHARRAAWGNEQGIPGVDAAGPDSAGATTTDDDLALTRNRKERRRMDREEKKEGRRATGKIVRSAAPARTDSDEPPSDGPHGTKKRVDAPNGKTLIVDSLGDVYLEEMSKEGQRKQYLLDVRASSVLLLSIGCVRAPANRWQLDAIPPPSVFDTVLFRLPLWLYGRTVGPVLSKPAPARADAADEPDSDASLIDIPTDVPAESRKRKSKKGGK